MTNFQILVSMLVNEAMILDMVNVEAIKVDHRMLDNVKTKASESCVLCKP